MHTAPSVVIVDDEFSIRKHLSMLLADQGYELHLLESGVRLLAEIGTLNPDLIILDVVMPEIDGLEVCRRLKADPHWKHIPIILSTVVDPKRILVDGTEAGADDYLPKPVTRLELQARVRSMLRIKRQYDELEGALKLREELSNMIIHDMSSPVVQVQLHNTLLGEAITNPEQRHHVEMIQAAADRLDDFINDILMLAKMEQKRLRVSTAPVDFNRLLEEVTEHLEVMAQVKNIRLLSMLPDEPLIRAVDENLFRRVVGNLLGNAIQYSPNESTVTLSLDPLGENGLRLKIMDEGPGIPAAARARIFDKYEVVDLKKKGIKQVGLGLTFCKMVVDAHGGNISIQDNTPNGAVFMVEL